MIFCFFKTPLIELSCNTFKIYTDLLALLTAVLKSFRIDIASTQIQLLIISVGGDQ